MIERAYTVKEIDDMRNTISTILLVNEEYLYPIYNYNEEYSKRSAYVEDRLRTYMLGGVSPQELKDKLKAIEKARDKLWKEQEAERFSVRS